MINRSNVVYLSIINMLAPSKQIFLIFQLDANQHITILVSTSVIRDPGILLI